ncbi:MAG: hypothetical protein R3E39_18510 [Anaerolineae bacterium]
MAYNVDWYVEDQVIYAKLVGNVTVQEFRTMMQSGTLMIDSVEIGESHFIFDFTRLEQLQNFGHMVQAMPKTAPKQMGWLIVVGENSPLKRFWGEAFARVAPAKFKRYDTIEQALAFLQKQDPNIVWQYANPMLLADNWPLLREVD